MTTAPPDVAIVGGMKCGTTALHRYLGGHPDVAASQPKELNYFFGDARGGPGNAWRGPQWYLGHFPRRRGLRLDTSPGYTSPDHPDVAERMAAAAPDARLIYLARDPLDRAVSQYGHHRRDGDERRPLDEALLDPESQYMSRSRHHERLQPFLRHFPPDRIAIVRHADLLGRRRATLVSLFRWLGIDPSHWREAYRRERNIGGPEPVRVPGDVGRRFLAAVVDDAAAFDSLPDEMTLRPAAPAVADGSGRDRQ